MTGTEQVLIEDWCQQYPSHSVGSLAFGADGALYVSGGDGASFNFADWGQDGSPLNPCGDPPGGPGSTLTPPTAEGGALRSQDLRTSGDPTSLDGALLRVDPATGQGLPDNPLAFSSDPNARRIVAHGFRNPFRIGVRPRTSEVWVGDVGWNTWEEVDRVDPAGAGRQLRLALLRGRGPAVGVRRRQSEHLREPLRGGRRSGDGPVLRLEPLRHGRPRRDLPDRGLLRRGDGVLRRRQLPRLRRRALLRRLLPRLHLGDAGGCGRAPRSRSPAHLRRGSGESRRRADRPGRGHLLRRLRRRHGAPDPLLQRQQAARRGRDGEPDGRRGPAPGHVQRDRARATRTRATRSPTPGISTRTASSTTRPWRSRRGRTRPPAPTSRGCG